MPELDTHPETSSPVLACSVNRENLPDDPSIGGQVFTLRLAG